MNTLYLLERMLMNGEITEDEYKERKAVYVETVLELYIKGILTKAQMQEKLNQYSEADLYIEEIHNALKALGVKGEAELQDFKFERITVYVAGEYFGIWDTKRKTFVD